MSEFINCFLSLVVGVLDCVLFSERNKYRCVLLLRRIISLTRRVLAHCPDTYVPINLRSLVKSTYGVFQISRTVPSLLQFVDTAALFPNKYLAFLTRPLFFNRSLISEMGWRLCQFKFSFHWRGRVRFARGKGRSFFRETSINLFGNVPSLAFMSVSWFQRWNKDVHRRCLSLC